MLSDKDFKTVIETTPLIAIDLIVKYHDKILLGLRKNRPAKNFYFVPGGRIYKNEKINDAIKRISKNELNIDINMNNLKFNTISEHFYDDNYFDTNVSTHYIVISYIYEVNMDEMKYINITNQHDNTIWMSVYDLLSNSLVHNNSKKYFYN